MNIDLSRRSFLKLAGAGVVATSLGSMGFGEAEAQERFGTHAHLIFLIMHGVMCGPSTKGSRDMVLTDLVLRTIDGVIDDALAQSKDR